MPMEDHLLDHVCVKNVLQILYIFSSVRVGHNEIIGVNRVGCAAEGLGRDHWNEMLAYPRKPIAHWHPLFESKKSEKEVCCFLNFLMYKKTWRVER